MRIAVVGVGPRGLSVLERVIGHTAGDGPLVELLLIEPGELGIGAHHPKQPDYLLLNTIAGQLTMFSDPAMVPDGPVTGGPTFLQWCRRENGAVRYEEFLPRRLIGEYLRWSAGELMSRLPSRLHVRHLPTFATAVRPCGAGAMVTLEGGETHQVDLAVVTTGHGLAAPAVADERLVETPYPLPDAVESVPGGATVAVLGTGLSAMDVVAALTVGRGGQFLGDAYRPSGREPRIVLANRSGWLPCARPATTPSRRAAAARFLTPAAIAALRADRPDGLLDFRNDLEPLVRQEVLGRMADASDAEIAFVRQVLDPVDETFDDYDAYLVEVLGRARFDLSEARRGLGVSLIKEGLEVLRDHREGIRAALDPPGLTPGSHRYFMETYTALVNRAVIGPQKERIQELLALVAAGVVRPGPGPSPSVRRTATGWILSSTGFRAEAEITADVLVRANLSWPVRDATLDPVGESLREWIAPGPSGAALALDRDGFALRRDGGTRTAIAVFGPPAEGASYYNHYVPSPAVWSRALTDLDRVLGPALSGAGA
ncbi:MAG: FAD/NAD(P)-binding protein [Actinomycetota bacterium]|nr:FAD/NAD(P)-binding protein [Actinomycetota bacterium]